MSRRSLALLLNVLLVVLGALLAVATNYATSADGHVPMAFRLVRDWSIPLVGAALVLLVGVVVLLHYLERPPSLRRRWDSKRPPYPGLEAYTEKDAGVFFGRDSEVLELLERLHPTGRRASRFVTVVGPSGSGKSSLLQAGLIPELERRRGRWIVVPPFVPSTAPLLRLARSLASSLPGTSATELADEVRDPTALARIVERIRAAHDGRPTSVLLVVDQLEELVTQTGERARDAFFALLRGALEQDADLWVIAILRSDFLNDFLSTQFASLFRHPVVVGPLAREALFTVIEKPAEQAGLEFEPGLVNRMVDEAGGGDALPLLAYALKELFLRGGSSGEVSEADYRELGGVAGALSRQADRISSEVTDHGDVMPVLNTLLKFVTLDSTTPTRRRVRRDELSGEERRVVDEFISGRLLTTRGDGEEAVIEIAHEALFRQWPPLRQAVEARADSLRMRTQLDRWARDWEGSGRQRAYLLTGERLRIAEQWAQDLAEASAVQNDKNEASGHLGALVSEFLDASRHVDRATLERLSEALANRALASVEHDPEQAVLLALAAVEEYPPTAVAYRALLASVSACRVRRHLTGHQDWVRGIAWSPDGRRIATASSDRTGAIWDAEGGSQQAVLRGHEAEVQSVAWSPDGRRIATASRDRIVRIWDAEDGGQRAVLRGHEAEVQSVAWSPDGRYVASGSSNHEVRIWDAELGGQQAVLRGHEAEVQGVAWSPDGRHIATASRDRTVRIWDVQQGVQVAALHGHRDRVYSVAWSPDGRRLASGSRDRTVRIWDVEHAAKVGLLSGHRDDVRSVAWSPDGQRIATGSYDGTVRIWDAESEVELTILRGSSGWVFSVAWSPDGKQVATASKDHVARIWDLGQADELAVLGGHTDEVKAVAWSDDGTRIATGSRDGTALVWDARSSARLACLRGHASDVRGLAWCPKDDRVATASYDGTVRIWDPGSGAELAVLSGHDRWVFSVAWSPDGGHVATSSRDRTARIWDLEQRSQLAVLSGHDDDVRCVAWSPDGRRIATSSRDRTVRIWEAKGGRLLANLRGHTGEVNGVGWSPDSMQVVTGSQDETAQVWDAEAGRRLAVLHGHAGDVRCVAWSPDGRRIATGSQDRTARIWDAEQGVEVAVLHGHLDWIESIAWSPDGRRIATGSRDHTVRVWDATADLESLVAKAHAHTFRTLSLEERTALFLPERST